MRPAREEWSFWRSGRAAGSSPAASNTSRTSWKVSTKSTAPARSGSRASAFLAMQGPTKTQSASGCSAFTARPQAIIGETEAGRWGIRSL